MKKYVLILLLVLTALLVLGCEQKKNEAGTQIETVHSDEEAVFDFINLEKDAKLWILPAADVIPALEDLGEPFSDQFQGGMGTILSLDELGGEGSYSIILLDEDHTYYEVPNVFIGEGYVLELKEAGPGIAQIAVKDHKAVYLKTYEGTKKKLEGK